MGDFSVLNFIILCTKAKRVHKASIQLHRTKGNTGHIYDIMQTLEFCALLYLLLIDAVLYHSVCKITSVILSFKFYFLNDKSSLRRKFSPFKNGGRKII